MGRLPVILSSSVLPVSETVYVIGVGVVLMYGFHTFRRRLLVKSLRREVYDSTFKVRKLVHA